jgi:peptidoglycan/xylan/chitin deacetylase (PgdA/CDA1 family)
MIALGNRSFTIRVVVALSIAVVALAVAGARPSAAARTVPPEAASIPPAVTVRHGPTDRPRIALTFDDNYQLPRAFETLRMLKQEHVPATMFVIGHYEDLGPDLTRQLAKDGFEIGDHTRSHADCPTLSWRALMIEIGNGTRTFRAVTGAPTARLFRPPGGFTDEFVARAAAAQGFRYVVLWDIDPKDWKGTPAAAIRETVLSQARNGAIVLLHMAAPHTAEALPGIISGLRSKGYELVTVTDLLKGSRRFVDVDPATADGKTILRMVDAGYLEPVDADYFGPSDPVTRAQLAQAAVSVAGPSPASASAGGPVDYQAAAASAGLVGPPSSGATGDAPINRLQLAQVLARMARTKGYGTQGDGSGAGGTAGGSAATNPETAATDLALVARLTDVPAYARTDVALAMSLGLIMPKSPTRFGVFALPERRQLATTLARFQDLPVVGPSTLGPGANDAAPGVPGATIGGESVASGRDGSRTHGLVIWLAGVAILGSLLVTLRLRAVASRR